MSQTVCAGPQAHPDPVAAAAPMVSKVGRRAAQDHQGPPSDGHRGGPMLCSANQPSLI